MRPLLLTCLAALCALASESPVLPREAFRHYIDHFNSSPTPDVVSHIPDDQAWAWMKQNVPFFTCPDPDFERTWYYRWWAYRKHIRSTPSGFILTEFLRTVGHATDHNAISCALGHHIAEGRWLRDPRYLDQYIAFWLRSGPDRGLQRHYHQFSNWTAAALYERYQADARKPELLSLLDSLLLDYTTWERDRLLPSGLFWQYDVRDGMEESISGGRRAKNARPTINSYMYGNAVAIARIARLAGRDNVAHDYERKAGALRRLTIQHLWNPQSIFFETLLENGSLAGVRELIGYSPWLFDLPPPQLEFSAAWKQLMDPQGFRAPFGPTTAEQRHPGFRIADSGDDCQWNGPSWPFSTTLTLKALANLLNRHPEPSITSADYFHTLLTYARSHQLTLPDGRVTAFVDENLNPFTGEWHARARKISKGRFNARGDHYNHSAFADLIITGLVGLRPREGQQITLNPLLPPGTWDWFCLQDVPYHGHLLTILWDRDGRHFGRGPGLQLFAGSRRIAHAPGLQPLTGHLPSRSISQ